MKLTNETKVGIIAIVSIGLLVLGFNFLKGKKLWSDDTTIYANYGDVQGLQKSNPVIINGLQVGNVYDIRTDEHMRNIVVELNITKDVKIPTNSICIIKTNPISTPSVEIRMGNAADFLKNKDTIQSIPATGALDAVLKNIDPVLAEVKKAVEALDTLLLNFNSILDPNAKSNLATTFANLNAITTSMVQSSKSLEVLLNSQSGALAQTLKNTNAITSNLASNNEKINHVVSNIDQTTTKLANLEFDKTLNTLNATIADLQAVVGKINSTEGSLGKLMNDPVLYNNLASTGNKLNLLIDDIRLNPKRYVSISVFGNKSKGSPLMVPLPDTLHSPYYIEKIKD